MRHERGVPLLSFPLRWLALLAVIGGCSSTPLGADGGEQVDGRADGPADSVSDGPTCAFDTVYRYGPDGGLVFGRDDSALTPPAAYEHARRYLASEPAPPPDLSCAPALPACGDPARVDVADIMRDIADPDVQAALAMATPPVFGIDPRPYDGTIFRFARADGRGFYAGEACDQDGGGQFCHGSVPAGVARLVADLRALDQQQLATEECVNAGFGPQN